MNDELYHLEYHRAIETAYNQLKGYETIAVYKSDQERFTKLCDTLGLSPQQMFRSLLSLLQNA